MNIPSIWRKAIYIGTIIAMAVLIGLGIATPEQLNESADLAVKIVGALAALLALANVNPD